MRSATLALVGMLFFGLGLAGAADADTAKKLVGVWEVTKSKDAPPGATVEFTKDGKMALKVKAGDKTLSITGTYKVKGQSVITTLSVGGKEKTETNKIKKLTEKELIVEDEKGTVEEYKRVK
jgi:uncharacterized protein (TIGR03066 family)